MFIPNFGQNQTKTGTDNEKSIKTTSDFPG